MAARKYSWGSGTFLKKTKVKSSSRGVATIFFINIYIIIYKIYQVDLMIIAGNSKIKRRTLNISICLTKLNGLFTAYKDTINMILNQ